MLRKAFLPVSASFCRCLGLLVEGCWLYACIVGGLWKQKMVGKGFFEGVSCSSSVKLNPIRAIRDS